MNIDRIRNLIVNEIKKRLELQVLFIVVFIIVLFLLLNYINVTRNAAIDKNCYEVMKSVIYSYNGFDRDLYTKTTEKNQDKYLSNFEKEAISWQKKIQDLSPRSKNLKKTKKYIIKGIELLVKASHSRSYKSRTSYLEKCDTNMSYAIEYLNRYSLEK